MPKEVPNTHEDDAITTALIGPMWDKEVPAFSMLWLSEPDASQHNSGLGTAKSLKALKGSDNNLARVLKELTARGVRDKTDVFVISDHGFSTISRVLNLVGVLKEAGFNAAHEFQQPPTNGDVMVVGNGGTALLYVVGHDPKLIHRMVDVLQVQDFAGVIFTREPMEGTFTLDQVRINTHDAPDIAVSMRWTKDKNDAGIPGTVPCESWLTASQGIHSSLSPFDMHNILIAAGPDFKKGMVDHLPSGNVDLAPTILHILGVAAPQHMDGRVLTEALIGETSKLPAPVTHTLNATHELSQATWQQYLRVTEFGGATYFDEGNGHQE